MFSQRQLDSDNSDPVGTLRRKLYDQTTGAHRVQKVTLPVRTRTHLQHRHMTHDRHFRAIHTTMQTSLIARMIGFRSI